MRIAAFAEPISLVFRAGAVFGAARPAERDDCRDDLRIDDIYLRARPVKLDRDLFGFHREVRTARCETAQWLDCVVPGEHCADERDRVPVSVPRVLAFSWRRHHFAVPTRGRPLRALRPPPRRPLAPGLW